MHSALWFSWFYLNSCQQSPAWPSMERAMWLAEVSIIWLRKWMLGGQWVLGLFYPLGSEFGKGRKIAHYFFYSISRHKINHQMTKWKGKKKVSPQKRTCFFSTVSQLQLILSLYCANLCTPQGISSLEKVHLLENVPESHFLKMQTFTPASYSTMKWN